MTSRIPFLDQIPSDHCTGSILQSLFQIEALLFGVAGFLEGEPVTDYQKKLQPEYKHLKNKYNLKQLGKHQWKFMRMRPANFPTVRIAQWATLLYRTGQLFSKMLVAANVKEIENAFVVELSKALLDYHMTDEVPVSNPY